VLVRVQVQVQVWVAVPLFVAAVVVAYYNRSTTKQECTECKQIVKILENERWHESWVYGLPNNMCHFVTVQCGLEALN
jgi:hypothetical protein